MAHTSRHAELIDGLISTIAPGSVSRAYVVKRLREHNYARTNQFAVKARLDGVLEKFAILSRNDLVAALQNRLDVLSDRDKFLPDKLALLLELSDLPYLKVSVDRVAAIESYKEPETTSLTWADIVRDDPLNEDIWDDIERGYHSSGDEAVSSPEVSKASSVTTSAPDLEDLARLQLIQPAEESLRALTEFTEVSVVREVLFMLRGLSTDIFVVDHRDGSVYISTTAILPQTTKQATTDILSRCAAIGSSLNFLRSWVKSSTSRDWIRSTQAAAERYLQRFDDRMSSLEKQYVQCAEDVVVSVMEISSIAAEHVNALIQLSQAIRHVHNARPVELLQQLFLTACEQQLTGDQGALDVIHKVLHAGIGTFIRPMVAWSLTGATQQDSSSLIVDLDVECTRAKLWHDRVALRGSHEVDVPAFLGDFAKELFLIGKSTMMLNLLNRPPDRVLPVLVLPEPDLFTPLQQQIEQAMTDFFAQLLPQQGSSLVATLIRDYGLVQHFDMLESMYLLKQATFFSNFSLAIYERTQHGGHRYLDAFTLTELAKTCIEPSMSRNISVVLETGKAHDVLTMLAKMRIHYSLPWYVANIVRAKSSAVHEEVLTLLLQLAHAKRMLQDDYVSYRKYDMSRLDVDQGMLFRSQQSMIAFIDTMTCHITSVGAQHHTYLRQDLLEATTFDDMIEAFDKLAKRLSIGALAAPGGVPRTIVVEILRLTEDIVQAKRSKTSLIITTTNIWKSFCKKIRSLMTAIDESLDLDRAEALTNALSACLPT